MRIAAALLTLMVLAGCSRAAAPSGPPGQASTTDVNPITGSRGGSGSGSSR